MQKEKKSLLVTGGLGFIGSHVVERFHPEFDIVVLDWEDKTDIAKERVAAWRRKGISVHQKDIADALTWETIEPCNFILHAAAQTAAVWSETEPNRDLWTNSLGTQLVAEYARRNSSKIIYCNTIRVYDSASIDEIYRENCAIDEDCPTIMERANWSPPFAYSKYSGECILRWYSEKYGLQVISHRMSGVVGPGQRSSEIHGWVSYLVKCAIDKKKYTIFGDGRQSRDILHIDDYVSLIEMELNRFEVFSEKGFRIYNIGGGPNNSLSINQTIKLLFENHGLKIEFINDYFRPGEPKHYVSKIEKINKKGWYPKHNQPEKILDDLVESYGGR